MKMVKVEQGSEQAGLAEDISTHWREVDQVDWMILKGSNYPMNNSHTKQFWKCLKSTASLYHEDLGTGFLSLWIETKLSTGQLE